MVVAGNVMKALFCTLVDDAVHCLAGDGDGDERLEERVHDSQFLHDNIDRNTKDTTGLRRDGDHLLLAVLNRPMMYFESW